MPTTERKEFSQEVLNRPAALTQQSRVYALRELARRSGVSRDFFSKWQISVSPRQTSLTFGPQHTGQIIFAHSQEDSSLPPTTGEIPVARAAWPSNLLQPAPEADLVLPFCQSDLDPSAPLYLPLPAGGFQCRLDLLQSILFTLSRVEECCSDVRDQHGRFPCGASIAFKDNFLERPILDEHGLAFQQILSTLFPSWNPEPRIARVKLTHDIDDIGIPFRLRSTIAHTFARRNPAATFRDLGSLLSLSDPAELALVTQLADLSAARGLHSAFFWKAGAASAHDSGYDPADPRVRKSMDRLREQGFELGVHPGYRTFADRGALASEVAYLRQALQTTSVGGRQHYLRWSPQTWLDWEACGLAYDSSVGFADAFGFRAGTSFPYRPWSFAENRELDLIEVPLALMDCTPVKYMRLSQPEGLHGIRQLATRIARVGGVFTVLWHNTPLMDPDYDGWYPAILDLISPLSQFQLPSRASDLW